MFVSHCVFMRKAVVADILLLLTLIDLLVFTALRVFESDLHHITHTHTHTNTHTHTLTHTHT